MQRAALAKSQNLWIQTGQGTGTRAMVNKLYAHCDRLSSHLYSPSELRFMINFESHYGPEMLSKASMASRVLTREWRRKNVDMLYSDGVTTSLHYGAAILKQMWGASGVEARLLMPWQFGVYQEGNNELGEQEALCESGLMTMSEVWRRISHLSNAADIYKQVEASARNESGEETSGSFFHQVLSTAVLSTSLENVRQQPGGIVQLSSDMSSAILGPQISQPLVTFHEIWVWDDERADYMTALLLEPNILISPQFKRENQFVPRIDDSDREGQQPFSLIQANKTPGYIWGRSEVLDLIELQGWIANSWQDVRRLLGIQFDKLLAFPGNEGIDNEMYDQFRTSGYIGLPPGAGVQDLTPKLPAEAFQCLEMANKAFEEVSGFDNVLSGRGEPGVRAGTHADMLMKTASPRLRDRSLLIERQCADASEKTLSLLEMKGARVYSTDPTESQASEFLLSQLPTDRSVEVDSHSSSPIFADDHKELITFGLKGGFVGGDSAIEALPYPNKDVLKARYKAMQEQKAKMLQQAQSNPELAKILSHSSGKK
jgi:hypothetical protein